MSRVESLTINVYSDVAGKPYVIIEGSADESGTSAPAMEMKVWAHEVTVIDNRRS
jgi:hypothetical protein